jgi:hypothetical protein
MDAMTPQAMLSPMPAQQPQNALAPMPAPTTHDVTVVTTKKLAAAKVLGVPPEEFGIERSARDIKTCNYCFHEVVTKTESELIDEGYDEDQIKSLGNYNGNTDIETIARDSVQEHMGQAGVNSAARLVKITEHYVRLDYEGKGRACLYMVITGGDQGEILRKDGKEVIEPIDVIPFATTTPVPITHRFFGRSIADLVMDIQRIKTALLRAALDSKYLSAGADVEVAEAMAGTNTIDDLLSPKRPGRVIRTKTPGGLNYQVVPDTSESSFAAMGYMDTLMESRTGVSKQGQGLDANALQNQSATAVAQVFSASQMRMKLIARIMAEGVRDIFALMHHTIRSHGQEAQTVRLRNTWTQVDPRNWKTRNDMTINVGLGSGGKAQQFAGMMALGNFQKELLAGGKANLVDDTNLWNTASELSKILGHKNADKFFNDPTAKDPQTGQPLHPPVPPPPPEAVQVAQIKAQTDQQNMQVQAQLDEQADQRKAQIETTQAQADIATQDRKTNAEMIQSQEEFKLKRELAILDFQLKQKLETEKMNMQREMHAQTMAQSAEQHRQQMAAGVFKVAAGAEQHDQKMEQSAAAAKAKPKGGK